MLISSKGLSTSLPGFDPRSFGENAESLLGLPYVSAARA